MGLFSFLRDVGAKLGGHGGAYAAPTPEALQDAVKRLGLPADDLSMRVQGDTIHLSGRVKDAETREKIILAVGNVAGVAKVEDKLDTPEPAAAEPVFHTVVKGDTLWKIAERTLGKGARYPEIFEANKPMLSDPDKIYPGQVLRIPAR